MCNESVDQRAPCGESELSYRLLYNGTYNHLTVKVRICAGAVRFGESVGIRGRFGRALSGWGDPDVRENLAGPYIYMTFGHRISQ